MFSHCLMCWCDLEGQSRKILARVTGRETALDFKNLTKRQNRESRLVGWSETQWKSAKPIVKGRANVFFKGVQLRIWNYTGGRSKMADSRSHLKAKLTTNVIFFSWRAQHTQTQAGVAWRERSQPNTNTMAANDDHE